jgi:hypothetical protein
VSTPNTTGFAAPTNLPAATLNPGMNTVTVRLTNLDGPTGFLFRGAVTSRCSREVEQSTGAGDSKD